MCDRPSQQAEVSSRQEIANLRSELLREVGIVEELTACEEVQEARLRSLRDEAAADSHVGKGFQDLDQRARRAQSGLSAARAHEEMLLLECSELERQLRQHAPAGTTTTQEGGGCQDGERLLDELRAQEAELIAKVAQSEKEEEVTSQAVQQLQAQVLDLSADCGSLLLDATMDEQRDIGEAAQFIQILKASLPATHQAQRAKSLNELLGQFEAELPVVQAALQHKSGVGVAGLDPLSALQDDVEELREEVKSAEAEAHNSVDRAEEAEVEASVIARRDALYDEDRLAEAARLNQECGLWRPQQAEWERSQVRLLRLVADLQFQRAKGTGSQALVVSRLGELQCELQLLSSPRRQQQSVDDSKIDMRLQEVLAQNIALNRQVGDLERERVELAKRREALLSLDGSLGNNHSTCKAGESHALTLAPPQQQQLLGGSSCYPPSP